jgi:hypothetical protein
MYCFLALSLVCGAAIALAGTPSASQATRQPLAPAPGAHARIEIEAEGTRRRMRAVFANGSDYAGVLRYRLVVRREGAAGASTTRQSGAFETQPGRTDTLSQTHVSAQPGDRLRATLSVFAGDRLVDEAALDTTLAR